MPRLLLVDDEPSQLKALQRTLRGLCPDLHLDLALSGEEALAHVRARAHDVIVADLRMPGMDGLTLLAQVARWQPLAVTMLLTGVADFATAQRALNETGIFRYLTKPWSDAELLLTIREAFEHKFLEEEKARLEALTRSQNAELKDLNANLEALVAERTEALAQAHRSEEHTSELQSH